MSKHICWRGSKRTCDRCSHSLFHAPHLNNSPRADNPCTQDHLHGTRSPGNFRLRPSVCFCSITAPGTQGAPLTRLYSAGEESPFRCTSLSVFCYTWGLLFAAPASVSALTSQRCVAGEHISVWAAGEELSCNFASRWGLHIQPGRAGITASSRSCRSTHSRGIICADSCGIRPETQASADARLPPPPPPPLYIPSEAPHTLLGPDQEVKWLCPCSSVSSPGVFTITVEEKR